jgi:hypothetical protein
MVKILFVTGLFFLAFGADLRAEGTFSYEVTYTDSTGGRKIRQESVYQESGGQKILMLERDFDNSSNQLISSVFRPPGGNLTNYNDGIPNQRDIVEGYISKARAPALLAGDRNRVDPKYIDAATPLFSTKARIAMATGAGLLALSFCFWLFRRI